MNYNKEIVLNFPLRNGKKNNLREEINIENELNEKLNRFFKLTERLRENEWHQEYLLIYNSYTIENA